MNLLSKYSDILLAMVVVGIVGMLIVPLPTHLLDILITANISIAVVLLLVAIYIPNALRISVYPTLLPDVQYARRGQVRQRFLDRCTRLTFESKAETLRPTASELAVKIWKAETGRKPSASKLQEIIRSTEQNGQVSFRRLVQQFTVALAKESAQ